MLLPGVESLKVIDKKVLVRVNYDVPLVDGKIEDTTRIEESLPTVKHLLEKKASQIILISHLGRPNGKRVPELSLKPVAKFLSSKFKVGGSRLQFEIENFSGFRIGEKIILLENIRFYPGEEANDLDFAKELAGLADFYINEAFACSHRKHASIVGVPKFFPPQNRAFGFDFLKEVEVLGKIRENPKRPLVLLLGGVKKDKIEYAKRLVGWADWVLVGGKLVEYDGIPNLVNHPKIIGNLIKNGEDITMETAEEFGKILTKAKTVVWAGPMGNFYKKGCEKGTKIVAEAVVKSGAFVVVGGGDTEAALSKFGLTDKVDFFSSGGGAMLEFLAEGTLPGIKAVLNIF